MKDYYALLGITEKATADEIKAAYHQKILASHSDKKTDKTNNEAASLTEAYTVLSNSLAREKYDYDRLHPDLKVDIAENLTFSESGGNEERSLIVTTPVSIEHVVQMTNSTRSELTELCKTNTVLAIRIINDPILSKRLTSYDLLEIAKSSVSLAKEIASCRRLEEIGEYGNRHFYQIAHLHVDAATLLLQRKTLASVWNGYFLYKLTQEYSEQVIVPILENAGLYEAYLAYVQLKTLSKNNHQLDNFSESEKISIRQLLATAKVDSGFLRLDELFEINSKIILAVLEDEKFANITKNIQIAELSTTVAKMMLQTSLHRQWLANNYYLVRLSNCFIEIFYHVLDDPGLGSLLSGEDLFKIATDHARKQPQEKEKIEEKLDVSPDAQKKYIAYTWLQENFLRYSNANMIHYITQENVSDIIEAIKEIGVRDESFIQNDNFIQKLIKSEICAREILTHFSVLFQGTRHSFFLILGKIALEHENLANEMLLKLKQNPETSEWGLNNLHAVHALAEYHESSLRIALSIHSVFCALINRDGLIKLVQKHPLLQQDFENACQTALDTPSFCKNVSAKQLMIMVTQYPSLRQKVIDNPTLLEKYRGSIYLGKLESSKKLSETTQSIDYIKAARVAEAENQYVTGLFLLDTQAPIEAVFRFSAACQHEYPLALKKLIELSKHEDKSVADASRDAIADIFTNKNNFFWDDNNAIAWHKKRLDTLSFIETYNETKKIYLVNEEVAIKLLKGKTLSYQEGKELTDSLQTQENYLTLSTCLSKEVENKNEESDLRNCLAFIVLDEIATDPSCDSNDRDQARYSLGIFYRDTLSDADRAEDHLALIKKPDGETLFSLAELCLSHEANRQLEEIEIQKNDSTLQSPRNLLERLTKTLAYALRAANEHKHSKAKNLCRQLFKQIADAGVNNILENNTLSHFLIKNIIYLKENNILLDHPPLAAALFKLLLIRKEHQSLENCSLLSELFTPFKQYSVGLEPEVLITLFTQFNSWISLMNDMSDELQHHLKFVYTEFSREIALRYLSIASKAIALGDDNAVQKALINLNDFLSAAKLLPQSDINTSLEQAKESYVKLCYKKAQKLIDEVSQAEADYAEKAIKNAEDYLEKAKPYGKDQSLEMPIRTQLSNIKCAQSYHRNVQSSINNLISQADKFPISETLATIDGNFQTFKSYAPEYLYNTHLQFLYDTFANLFATIDSQLENSKDQAINKIPATLGKISNYLDIIQWCGDRAGFQSEKVASLTHRIKTYREKIQAIEKLQQSISNGVASFSKKLDTLQDELTRSITTHRSINEINKAISALRTAESEAKNAHQMLSLSILTAPSSAAHYFLSQPDIAFYKNKLVELQLDCLKKQNALSDRIQDLKDEENKQQTKIKQQNEHIRSYSKRIDNYLSQRDSDYKIKDLLENLFCSCFAKRTDKNNREMYAKSLKAALANYDGKNTTSVSTLIQQGMLQFKPRSPDSTKSLHALLADLEKSLKPG